MACRTVATSEDAGTSNWWWIHFDLRGVSWRSVALHGVTAANPHASGNTRWACNVAHFHGAHRDHADQDAHPAAIQAHQPVIDLLDIPT